MLEEQSKKEHEIIDKQDVDIEAVEEETVEAVKEVVIKAMKEEFSGPIPHPDTIRKYEEILPGAADRIISMAERQALHRQEMERKMITAESRDGLLGVVFAFMLGIGCIIAAVIMVCLVPKSAGVIAGALLGVTGIGSITSNFIRSARSNRESENKKKDTDT